MISQTVVRLPLLVNQPFLLVRGLNENPDIQKISHKFHKTNTTHATYIC